MYDSDSYTIGWIVGAVIVGIAFLIRNLIENPTFFHLFFMVTLSLVLIALGRKLIMWMHKVRDDV